MPWIPSEQEKMSLETQIKQKWVRETPPLTKNQITDCVTSLKRAKNKAQAEAVLGAVSSVTELTKLNQAWYEGLKNNDAKTIKDP